MIYRFEIRDNDLDFVGFLDGRIQNLRWEYNPKGGCGGINFDVKSKYCTEVMIGQNFNLQLKKRNILTGNFDLIYQGRIENIDNTVKISPEIISVSGFGYQSALNDIVINEVYTSTETSAIVKDILDNYIVNNTLISYDPGDIEATSFTPTSMKFEYVTAKEAFSKLADLLPNIEWGVDKDRKFYFKQRSDSPGHIYPIMSPKLLGGKVNSTSRGVANNIIVIGGDVSGNKYIYSKSYPKSQVYYGRRDHIINNSAVTTDDVGEQITDAYYSEHKGSSIRGVLSLKDDKIFETENPIRLVMLKTREIFYDEKKYDTFQYADPDPFRIRSIKYRLSEQGDLLSELEIGQPIPRPAEDIKRLEYEINQLLQARD